MVSQNISSLFKFFVGPLTNFTVDFSLNPFLDIQEHVMLHHQTISGCSIYYSCEFPFQPFNGFAPIQASFLMNTCAKNQSKAFSMDYHISL
jgi:hypothetical protein